MNKYLIQWTTFEFINMSFGDIKAGHRKITNHVKVGDFYDKDLEDFCQDKSNLKVTFLCEAYNFSEAD